MRALLVRAALVRRSKQRMAGVIGRALLLPTCRSSPLNATKDPGPKPKRLLTAAVAFGFILWRVARLGAKLPAQPA
jgi:hypothetical protein